MLASAVGATKQGIRRFHTVTNNTAATMGTRRRKRMDRALETVEDMSFTAHLHFKAFVIPVATDFAGRRLTA
jgi:hypothetical protein